MAINIKNPEADRLANELAKATGESVTRAIIDAMRDRLATLQRQHGRPSIVPDVSDIQALVASLPDRDFRPVDEILGYDSFGLPD